MTSFEERIQTYQEIIIYWINLKKIEIKKLRNWNFVFFVFYWKDKFKFYTQKMKLENKCFFSEWTQGWKKGPNKNTLKKEIEINI